MAFKIPQYGATYYACSHFFMVPAMIPPFASSPLFSPFLGLLLAFFPAIKLGQSLLRLAEVAQAGVCIDRLKAERVL